jgi:hypothetical protein
MKTAILGPILLTVLSVLFWLWKKEKAEKAAKDRERLESQGYLPISIEDQDPDVVTRLAGFSVRVAGGVSLAVLVFVIAALVIFGVDEPLVRWILAGTLGLVGLILVVWALRQMGQAGRPR